MSIQNGRLICWLICESETLSLAARPGDGPLMLWQTYTGVTAALIAGTGLSAAAPMRIVGPDVTVLGASAAWVAGRFYVAVAIAPRAGGSEALRIVAINNDGSGAMFDDFAVSSVDGTPRLAVGADDLRVTYPGVPGVPVTSVPPLVVTEAEVAEIADLFEQSVAHVSAQVASGDRVKLDVAFGL